jgi:hypothetical protein
MFSKILGTSPSYVVPRRNDELNLAYDLNGITGNQATNEAPTKWNIIELQIVHYNLYESN